MNIQMSMAIMAVSAYPPSLRKEFLDKIERSRLNEDHSEWVEGYSDDAFDQLITDYLLDLFKDYLK